jgi:hypothetical protein
MAGDSTPPAGARALGEAGAVTAREIGESPERRLAADERDGLGSVSWYTTVVKLDLEVKGELRRLPGSPQRLVRA